MASRSEDRRKNRSPKSIAYKAIGLAPDLSGNDRRVACALIDHFNLTTGRCDPSISRLATLLAISEATVKRATKALTTATNARPALFSKRSHGGTNFNAAYLPLWANIHSIVHKWDEAMRSFKRQRFADHNSSDLSCSMAQNCALGGSKTELQNRSRKPSKETKPTDDDRSGDTSRRRALETSDKPHPLERTSHMPRQAKSNCGQNNNSPSHIDAANCNAIDRIMKEIYRLPDSGQVAMEKMSAEELKELANAEIQRRGSGLAQLRDWLAGQPILPAE